MAQWKIDKRYVSVFASGLSIDDISEDDYKFLYDNTYCIGTNYFFLKYCPHILMWTDITITKYIIENVPEKQFMLMSRKEAFKKGKENLELELGVDHWFGRDYYNLYGNFTAFWAIQLVKKFYPDKVILLFGFDFYFEDDKVLKYYDRYTDTDSRNRNNASYKGHTMDKFRKWMEKWCADDARHVINIFNCNPKSTLECFPKKDFREVIK